VRAIRLECRLNFSRIVVREKLAETSRTARSAYRDFAMRVRVRVRLNFLF